MRILGVVGVVAGLAWSSASSAQVAAPGPDADSGVHRHDGFYLRLGLGGGALKADFTGGEPNAPDATAKGGSVLMDILLGGTPARGLVVGGGYHVVGATEPEFEVGANYTGSGGSLFQGVVGPFVDFFPDDEGGFDVGALAGMALVQLSTPKIFGFGEDISHRGFGASAFAGYTLWLASQWSMGLTGRVTWTTTTNTDVSDQTGKALGWGFMLTAIYH
jgi:hypothetical protein